MSRRLRLVIDTSVLVSSIIKLGSLSANLVGHALREHGILEPPEFHRWPCPLTYPKLLAENEENNKHSARISKGQDDPIPFEPSGAYSFTVTLGT